MSEDFHSLTRIPERMAPWRMRLDLPLKNDYGQYALIGCEPATIEQHHQVTVVDEGGDPLPGVWVIFGYPGSNGPLIPLEPKENYWLNSPKELVGNYQKTNMMGYAQHTVGQGGEDIFVWDVDGDGALKLASVMVRNCTWITTEAGGPFNHSGVHLAFQRRRAGVPVVSRQKRLENLEARVAELEQAVRALHSVPTTDYIEAIGKPLASQIGNISLRIEVVEARLGIQRFSPFNFSASSEPGEGKS